MDDRTTVTPESYGAQAADPLAGAPARQCPGRLGRLLLRAARREGKLRHPGFLGPW
jgi:hypothetical protein